MGMRKSEKRNNRRKQNKIEFMTRNVRRRNDRGYNSIKVNKTKKIVSVRGDVGNINTKIKVTNDSKVVRER